MIYCLFTTLSISSMKYSNAWNRNVSRFNTLGLIQHSDRRVLWYKSVTVGDKEYTLKMILAHYKLDRDNIIFLVRRI